MRGRTGLLLFAFLLAAGCDKRAEESLAPQCVAVDELLLRLNEVNEDAGMRENFQESIQQLPQETQGKVVQRIRERARVDGGGMLAADDTTREWVALLLLSRKAETRATKKFRYCAGDFDFGNGSAWRWHYSLSSEEAGPALRILNAQIVVSDVVEGSGAAGKPDRALAALEADFDSSIAPQNGAADAVPENHEDPAEIAPQVAARAPAVGGELGLAAREDVKRAEAAAAAVSAEARAIREQAEYEGNLRLAEEQAAQQQATEQQVASEQPSPDSEYERRRSECAGGFMGKSCRHDIREQVCAGHWKSDPGPGEAVCKR